ncbi:MAG: hypothetical protein IPK75_01475 [Acidobacteria bacterium]|nr:hypothetical protein [Acidobacteriota bacterium]
MTKPHAHAGFLPDLRARLGAIGRQLVFGEAAMAAGLKGSSRAGWTCPACQTEGALAERSDHQGARCTAAGCRKGFDLAGVVMTARGLSVVQAMTLLERVIAEKAARGNDKAPGLFGDAP